MATMRYTLEPETRIPFWTAKMPISGLTYYKYMKKIRRNKNWKSLFEDITKHQENEESLNETVQIVQQVQQPVQQQVQQQQVQQPVQQQVQQPVQQPVQQQVQQPVQQQLQQEMCEIEVPVWRVLILLYNGALITYDIAEKGIL